MTRQTARVTLADAHADPAGAAPRPFVVAVTGAPGAGKSSRLVELAGALTRAGCPFDGVVALARGPRPGGRGASEYVWLWPRTGRALTVATRQPDGDPPYVFHADTLAIFQVWAESLAHAEPQPQVVLLDEFGRAEAAGGGWIGAWPAIRSAGPALVVIGLREGTAAAAAGRLGQPIDLIVQAEDPATPARLAEMALSARDWHRIARHGAAAGGIEVALGSVLHATRIPLRGMMLAAIQSGVLFLAGGALSRPGRVQWVAYVAAALKSLSPAGNRFRPMIAIAMQGTLFATAVRLLGWNAAGTLVGAGLVGAWSGIQGFVIQVLLLGRSLFDAYGEVQRWVHEYAGLTLPSLPAVVAAYVALSAAASIGLVAVLRRRERPPAWFAHALEGGGSSSRRAVSGGALPWHRRFVRELRARTFWLPLVVVVGLLAVSGQSWVELAGVPLRALGVLAAIVVLFTALRPARLADHLQRRGHWGPALLLRRVLGQPLQSRHEPGSR